MSAPAGGHIPDILTVIKNDHRRMFDLYDEFLACASPHQRQHLAWQIIRELSVHSIAEEEVLYPAMVDVMGTEVTTTSMSGHEA